MIIKIGKLPEPGHAREENYTPSKSEEFGLNKRTRRLDRGDKNVTTPDGKLIDN